MVECCKLLEMNLECSIPCSMAHILVLDDESEICEEVAYYLTQQGHQVEQAHSIFTFNTCYEQKKPDIVVVDRMLPDGDGLDAVYRLREKGHRCGVVMFSAKDASQDRIDGFRYGADHYLTKPVRMQELGAVVQALAWRLQVDSPWLLNPSTYALLTPYKDRVQLTKSEVAFLVRLSQAQGKTVTRQEVLIALDKNPAAYDVRNLDVFIMRLKQKVAEATDIPFPLKTVHGVGYCIPAGLSLSDI
jgi:two-component system, OmpR family, response regulator